MHIPKSINVAHRPTTFIQCDIYLFSVSTVCYGFISESKGSPRLLDPPIVMHRYFMKNSRTSC